MTRKAWIIQFQGKEWSRGGFPNTQHTQSTAQAHFRSPLTLLPCEALSHTCSFVGCIFHCFWNLEGAFLVQTTREHFWGRCEKEIKHMRRYIQGHLLKLFFNGRTLANLHIYKKKKKRKNNTLEYTVQSKVINLGKNVHDTLYHYTWKLQCNVIILVKHKPIRKSSPYGSTSLFKDREKS